MTYQPIYQVDLAWWGDSLVRFRADAEYLGVPLKVMRGSKPYTTDMDVYELLHQLKFNSASIWADIIFAQGAPDRILVEETLPHFWEAP